ncbi:ankyrin [Choiromyces venosus 120613-1]|uniref:Ankyrin n=1 Tax=Choiromyces venosus 120613-1 TaxID=1336337 RepID=A0A3N4JYL6_9PEZI|nr:ankyrin [Choiromyces venosus 120613-1]
MWPSLAFTATTALGALLKQVVAGMEPISSEIKSAFESAKKQVDGRTLRLPEICTILVKSLSCLRRGFICIGALDECPQKNRPELWDSLQHIIQECPNTRLFITGRPHIQDEVRRYFGLAATMIPIKPRTEDIERYLEMRLNRDPDADIMDESFRVDILRVIPETISEIFLLVSLIMDAILDQTTIHKRRQMLYKMTNGLGLQDAYSATLHRINEQKGSRRNLAMEALMWISHSERPLKAEELRHALAVEAGTTDLEVDDVPSIRTLLGCTLGLVTVDQQSSTVRLIHFTLQEYLGAHTNLFITPHSMMAEICLTYLNFRSICKLSPTLRTIPPTTPFLHYASCYWGLHARKEMNDRVKSLALQLLQRNADHISADILLREKSLDFLSLVERSLLELLGHEYPDRGGYTGLHCIAYMRVPEIEIAMVDMEIWDMNRRDSKGATPLMWAAKYGNYTLTKLLLEQVDVNPNLSDWNGLTPLAHASKGGFKDVVELLLNWVGVNPSLSCRDGRTPLSWAAEYGQEEVVKLLLDRDGANPDSLAKNGRTPLSYAAQGGNEVVVKLLLDRESVNPVRRMRMDGHH